MALIAKRGNALKLEALDEAAEALGLEVGSTLAAARARVPELIVMDADPAADLNLLTAIGEMCRRYAPGLSLDPPDGVNVDITGAAGLFGGERKLADDLRARLRRQGIEARIGIGRTLPLAWATARCGDGRTVTTIQDLPVGALRLDAGDVGILNRLGLRTVGQILAIPRPALARRLGVGLLARLDETLGDRDVALTFAPEPVVFYVQHRLAEPIALEVQVLRLCRWLAERLGDRLERRHLGGRVFALDLFRVDGVRKRLVVKAARPLRDPARVTALFAERLAALNDGLEADFGFDLLRLTAEAVERIDPATEDFAGGTDDRDFASLIDLFSARLGESAVWRLAPATDSRIPERATLSLPFSAAAPNAWAEETPALYGGTLLRPLTLFDPPQPVEVIAGVPEDAPRQFRWRRLSHAVVKAEGPERIAQEWWSVREPTPGLLPSPPEPAAHVQSGALGESAPPPDRRFRDYYRVEDDRGRRFWLFREGAFGASAPPRWFVHGLFP